ncbi:hypothetical protein MPS_3804 [Mycobacterium pseudoshottsii JCM 15466]|nr:hypothetical protein MMSP_2272 [Mycobacterium sp. 012931]EPQ77703.1 hypothetical protein MMMB2_2365 [Mycobacterium marinum MB2]GAQ37679.1 hypothetical protein MPS_3804 [Mycobacterium pseudoshottsii JCM 15466]
MVWPGPPRPWAPGDRVHRHGGHKLSSGAAQFAVPLQAGDLRRRL